MPYAHNKSVQATVLLCKALAAALNAVWSEYDRETSALMTALADYVTKYGK